MEQASFHNYLIIKKQYFLLEYRIILESFDILFDMQRTISQSRFALTSIVSNVVEEVCQKAQTKNFLKIKLKTGMLMRLEEIVKMKNLRYNHFDHKLVLIICKSFKDCIRNLVTYIQYFFRYLMFREFQLQKLERITSK